jgi:hypothetical protein
MRPPPRASGPPDAAGRIGVVALGVDRIGQPGRTRDQYAQAGIEAERISGSALLALELRSP